MSPTFRRAVWNSIVGIAALIAVLIVASVGLFGSGYVRHLYLPSEAMAPR